MTARERLVRVVTEALIRHQRVPMYDGTQGQRCGGCDHLLGTTDGPNSPRHAEHQAEAVVAAMEAEMGLRVESEPVSDITITGPGGSLTVHGPLQYRLVTDWVSDEGGNDE